MDRSELTGYGHSALYVRKMKTAYSDVFEQRKSNHAVAPWCFELQPLERSHQGISIEFIMVLQQVFDLSQDFCFADTEMKIGNL